MSPFPRRWFPILRVLALALFALALVVQPVMAAVGEMHELAHDPSGAHSHALHTSDAGAEAGAAAEQPQPDDAAVLHLLLHFAHCCGAAVALLHAPKLVAATQVANRMVSAKTSMPTQTRPVTPYKPPILA